RPASPASVWAICGDRCVRRSAEACACTGSASGARGDYRCEAVYARWAVYARCALRTGQRELQGEGAVELLAVSGECGGESSGPGRGPDVMGDRIGERFGGDVGGLRAGVVPERPGRVLGGALGDRWQGALDAIEHAGQRGTPS